MTTRLYLTGRLALEHDGALVFDERDLPGRQGRLAFAFLATRLHRPAPRALFVEVLWPADPPRELDVTLSAVLSRLRALLRRSGVTFALEVTPGAIELRLPGDVWIDLEAAANTIDEAEGAWRRGDQANAWSSANVGVAIAHRPFLVGEEAPWIESIRTRLTQLSIRGLQCLSDVSAAKGESAVAIQHATEIVDLDPYRETAYQHLMRLHAGMSNAAEALRVYARCREHLREELGASPSPETERLYLAILRGEV